MNLEIGTMSVRSIFKDADKENLEDADNKKTCFSKLAYLGLFDIFWWLQNKKF